MFITNLQSDDFFSTLENALFVGGTLIIENLEEYIDPLLNPILLKQVFVENGTQMIKVGNDSKEFD